MLESIETTDPNLLKQKQKLLEKINKTEGEDAAPASDRAAAEHGAAAADEAATVKQGAAASPRAIKERSK